MIRSRDGSAEWLHRERQRSVANSGAWRPRWRCSILSASLAPRVGGALREEGMTREFT